MTSHQPPNKFALIPVAIIHLTAATLTWRDLAIRSDAEVRGPKPLWRVASAINTLGSAAYWLFGRR